MPNVIFSPFPILTIDNLVNNCKSAFVLTHYYLVANFTERTFNEAEKEEASRHAKYNMI